jgi:hypothetical protein
MYIKYILVLFSFFVLSSSVYAEHQGTDKETIKALVEKVKTAEPSQRRLLMNELKIKLRSMHQETRTQVMLDLRRSFNGHQRGEQGNRAIESNMHHQNTMSMTESKHMQEHMTQSTMETERPTGQRPPVSRPPMQDTPVNTMAPQRPTNTDHTPMRGM